MSSLERFSVRLAVFLGGAILMAAEVCAFRVVGKSFGTALRETTAVIAVFLTAMSAGYWMGGKAGDRWPRSSTLVAVLFAGASTLFLVPWLDAVASPRIAASVLSLRIHAFIVSGVLFVLPTAFFAAVSPIAIRLFATTATESGTTAGSVSALSTAGSIAGSIVTAYFLLEWLESITRTIFAISLAAFATGALILAASIPRLLQGAVPLRRRLAGGALAVVLVALTTGALVRATGFDAALQPSPGGSRVLFAADSPYHRITVREHAAFREMDFDIYWQGRMTVSDPFGPGLPYTDASHLARLLRPKTRRILVIGLGAGTVPKQMERYYPDTTVDVVEIDPLVVDVAKRFFFVRPDDRLHVHVEDGRLFLKHSAEKWDLILVDAYASSRYGSTTPPHLVTLDFFREAAAHLEDGGILQFHNGMAGHQRFQAALEKTMSGVFPAVMVSGGEILGSFTPMLADKDVLRTRTAGSPASRLQGLLPAVNTLAPAGKFSDDTPLLTDDYAPIDSLLRR